MRIGEMRAPQRLGGRVFREVAEVVAVLLCVIAVINPAEARRYASIVLDAETGTVLHESHADRSIYPASLTKMMTLYLLFEALENGDVTPNERLKVSKRAAGQPPTDLRLRAGDTITVRQAIRALIIRSANDVATVVAEALGGTEEKFARLMTKRARELGMENTTFRNASGLPNRNQVSTVRDLGMLAHALMRDFPGYYHLFSLEAFTYDGRTYETHNNLVANYPGADGLKTGYIRASGFNLAASAIRNGRRLIAIVVGGRTAQSRDKHTAILLDRGFNKIASGNVQLAAQPGWTNARFVVPPPKPPVPESAISVAMSALVPSAEAAERDGPLSGGWGIQVGAFSDFEPAHRVARKAAQDAANLLDDARVVVHERAKNDRTLFRARVIGLTEKDARTACRVLETKKTPCLVVRLENTVALNDAR